MGRNRSTVCKSSKMFCCILFTWLGMSVLLLTLYLNSVCHGSRTELQPRWLPCPRHHMFLMCLELLSLFLSCSSPSILSEFLSPEFCMFQASCVLGTGGESPASIPPPASPLLSHSSMCAHVSLPPGPPRLMHLPLQACCLPGSALSLWLGRGNGGERVLELFPRMPSLAIVSVMAEWEKLQQPDTLHRTALTFNSPGQSMAGPWDPCSKHAGDPGFLGSPGC